MKNRDLLDLKGGTGEIPNDSIGLEKLTPDLRDKIQNPNLLAKDITVEDMNSLFEAINVEDALKENMNKTNVAMTKANEIDIVKQELEAIRQEIDGIKANGVSVAIKLSEI